MVFGLLRHRDRAPDSETATSPGPEKIGQSRVAGVSLRKHSNCWPSAHPSPHSGSRTGRPRRRCSPTAPREQKQRFLPGIAGGEISWAIKMSEPESGPDLASVRTKAVRVDGGWRITGTKLWTSGAHRADAFFALARSAPLDPAQRHAGLSQFIVLLDSPGVQIRPILSMSGDHHFNEVILDDVFVPDELCSAESAKAGSRSRPNSGSNAVARNGSCPRPDPRRDGRVNPGGTATVRCPHRSARRPDLRTPSHVPCGVGGAGAW